MGLPSGVQWASCNVGASKPSDLGLYFSWGNIEGHIEGEGYDFSQEVYNNSPAANIATDLSLDHDAARLNLGAPWRMPTADEFQELFENCTTVWTTLHGVNGHLLISNLNGNEIFLPAAGDYNGTLLNHVGMYGYYWSKTYISEAEARNLYFYSTNYYPLNSRSRRLGFPVRAVLIPE